jgi:hypothetical protein
MLRFLRQERLFEIWVRKNQVLDQQQDATLPL